MGMSETSRRRWLAAIPAAAVLPLLAQDPAPASGVRTFNVRDYGAKGDGQTLDTAAVQAAIDACERDRGGVVLIPAGDFLVGTVQLKSNVTLHVAASGRLLGSGKPADFSAGKGVPPGNGNVVMLYAVNADNVTVEGPGTIDGQGQLFYTGKGDNTGPGGNSAEGYRERPHLAIFYRCRNLQVRDIFLTRSAYHCVRILECNAVRLDGVRIHNRVNLNNDGFHLNSNQYVHIVNCNIMCQDDACALFGSNNSSLSPIRPSAPVGRSSASEAARRRTSRSPTASSTTPTAAPSRSASAPARAWRTSRSRTWSCATSLARFPSDSIPTIAAPPTRRRDPRA